MYFTDDDIVVVMIVKNEEENIIKTLQKFLPKVKRYCILDTGSTDKTISIINDYFDQNNLNNGKVFSENYNNLKYKDYELMRNKALELARQNFNTSKYLIMVDCDWYLNDIENLYKDLEYKYNNNNQKDIHSILVKKNGYELYMKSIFLTNSNVKYLRPIHEYVINGQDGEPINNNIYFDWIDTEKSIETRKKRWLEDIEVMKQLIEDEIDIDRYTYYLAKTYNYLNDHDNALKYYLKRIDLNGFIDQLIDSLLMIAYYYKDDWDKSFYYYWKIFTTDNNRIEGLYQISEYYRLKEKYLEQYTFDNLMCKIEDKLIFSFIDKSLYQTKRFINLIKSTYKLGYIDECYEACQKYINYGNDIKKNLTIYEIYIKINASKINSECEHIEYNEDQLEDVTIAILAKDKSAVLHEYLKSIELLEYPKNKINIYIRTNDNNDNTPEILKEWMNKVQNLYKSFHYSDTNVNPELKKFSQHEWNPTRYKILGLLRQLSINHAYKKKSHYFVIDCDNFVKPFTLAYLMLSGKPVIAPMLRNLMDSKFISEGPVYSNFHADIDQNGYYKSCDQYYKIFNCKQRDIFEVPVVHCTYFIRYEYLLKMCYDFNDSRMEYVVFSDQCRIQKIPQFIDNRYNYGYLTFADFRSDFERFIPKLDWLNIKDEN